VRWRWASDLLIHWRLQRLLCAGVLRSALAILLQAAVFGLRHA
jgi:hypothetical protein